MEKTSKQPPQVFGDLAALSWIQFVVGFILVAWGAYFLGPWEAYQYTINPTISYSEEIVLGPLAALFQVAAGTACMVGSRRMKSAVSNTALIAAVVSYTMIVSIRIMVIGAFPMYWLFQLGLALIAMILLIRSGLRR